METDTPIDFVEKWYSNWSTKSFYGLFFCAQEQMRGQV